MSIRRLGADDEQTARLADLLCQRLYLGAELVIQTSVYLACCKHLFGDRHRRADGCADNLLLVSLLSHLLLCKELGVAAEQDIGASTRHVRSDGNGAETTCLCDYLRLALMVLCIKHGVLDALETQTLGEHLRLLDRNGTDEHRLPFCMAFLYLSDDGVVFALLIFIYNIVVVDADHRPVGRHLDDVERINLAELVLLGQRRAQRGRHAFHPKLGQGHHVHVPLHQNDPGKASGLPEQIGRKNGVALVEGRRIGGVEVLGHRIAHGASAEAQDVAVGVDDGKHGAVSEHVEGASLAPQHQPGLDKLLLGEPLLHQPVADLRRGRGGADAEAVCSFASTTITASDSPRCCR